MFDDHAVQRGHLLIGDRIEECDQPPCRPIRVGGLRVVLPPSRNQTAHFGNLKSLCAWLVTIAARTYPTDEFLNFRPIPTISAFETRRTRNRSAIN